MGKQCPDPGTKGVSVRSGTVIHLVPDLSAQLRRFSLKFIGRCLWHVNHDVLKRSSVQASRGGCSRDLTWRAKPLAILYEYCSTKLR
jgi:hypothetical protein